MDIMLPIKFMSKSYFLHKKTNTSATVTFEKLFTIFVVRVGSTLMFKLLVVANPLTKSEIVTLFTDKSTLSFKPKVSLESSFSFFSIASILS